MASLELKHFMDVSRSSTGLGFAVLGSYDISQSIVIGDDKCIDVVLQKLICFEDIQEPIPLFVVFRLQVVVGDGKVYEKLVSIRSLSDHDMPKESLMRHLVIGGES